VSKLNDRAQSLLRSLEHEIDDLAENLSDIHTRAPHMRETIAKLRRVLDERDAAPPENT
jgi:DNA-binding ferritin-like protein